MSNINLVLFGIIILVESITCNFAHMSKAKKNIILKIKFAMSKWKKKQNFFSVLFETLISFTENKLWSKNSHVNYRAFGLASNIFPFSYHNILCQCQEPNSNQMACPKNLVWYEIPQQKKSESFNKN